MENFEAASTLLTPLMKQLGAEFTRETAMDMLETLILYYPSLDSINRRKVRQAFNILNMGNIADALNGDLDHCSKDSSFACPTLQTRIVSPCRVRSCRYNIDLTEGYNCLLAYSDMGSMDQEKIAYAMGDSIANVSDIRLRAIRKMRQAAVPVAQERAEVSSEFIFLKNEKVCGCCERRIEGSPFYTEEDISFCSSQCVSNCHPSHVVLESRFGIPAVKLIQWVYDNFESVEAASHSLKFPPSVLERAIEQARRAK